MSPEEGVAETASVVAEGDGTGQMQGEGGEGEKPDVEDEAKPAQEGQDNLKVSCFCCPSKDLKLILFGQISIKWTLMEQTPTFACYIVGPIELKRVKRIEADWHGPTLVS